jgi:c-di-GMP-binding flagellar brake protein YcgR
MKLDTYSMGAVTMSPMEISLGTRLELDVFDINGEKVGSTYVSQLLEYQDDTLLIISAPIYEARLVYIPDDMIIRLTFIHNRQGLLGFSARVKSKEFRGNVAVIIIEPEGEIEKIQRRKNYRLDIVLDVLMWLPGIDKTEPVKAYTKNISGSGLCVISETEIPKNTEIKLELDLSADIQINTKCLVLTVSPAQLRKGKGFKLGMHFTEITQKSQDTLIKFIFHQQRILIKKEMEK